MDTSEIRNEAQRLKEKRGLLAKYRQQREAINSDAFCDTKIIVRANSQKTRVFTEWEMKLSDQFGNRRRGTDMLRLAMIKITDERIAAVEQAIGDIEANLRKLVGVTDAN